MSQDQHLSFAIGTAVEFTEAFKAKGKLMPKPNHDYQCEFQWIVCDVSVQTGELKYAVNGMAWFAHADLKFVDYATEASVNFAIEEMGEEEEEEDEEDLDWEE